MANKMMKWIDKLVDKSEHPVGLFFLEKIFTIGIPFNIPHSISFKKLDKNQSRLRLKYTRLNRNHLKGIHACAICTVGEFAAGILLCKNFPMTKYRVIMKSLKADYAKQARSHIFAQADISEADIRSIKDQVEKSDQGTIEIKTVITDESNQQLAVITTLWQLKDWSKTKY